MRLELEPQPIQITLSDPPDQPADAELPPSRVVGGLVVPYGQTARIQGRKVTFRPGSVHAREHVPMLLGHNVDRPIGLMVTSAQGDAGLSGVFAIDQTADGDTAIVQARSGSRRGLSAGVDVIEANEDADGNLDVIEGELAEVSQVTLAAYTDAAITQIAAQETDPQEGEKMDTQPDQPATDAPAHLDAEIATQAERRQPVIVTAERSAPDMRLGEYVQTLVKAERGDTVARQRIEAALDRQTIGTNPGVVPIAYVNDVLDSLGADRPLFDAMKHADMPAAGMTIRQPEVTTRPDGNWLPDDTAGAPTTPVNIGNKDVNIRQWAWGGSASVALVERSSPSYVEEVFKLVLESYYRDVEASIAAAFPTAASTITSLGGAVAAFMTAYRRFPNLIVAGADAYGKLLDATGVFLFTSGSANADGTARYAGMEVVPSADVAAADAWVTTRDFQVVRESSPIRLSVSDVTSLSLEIGVTSFYAQTDGLQHLGTPAVPGAVRIAGFQPVTAGQAAPKAERK